MNQANKQQMKYLYRNICGVIEIAVMTGIFYFVWYEFAKFNNQTGHLLGTGNLLMAVGVYVILLIFFNKIFGGFRIGVHRKMNTIAGQLSGLFVADVLEIFASMAITGQFRFMLELTEIYALMFVGQSVLLVFMTIKMVDLYRKLFPPLKLIEIYSDKESGLGRIMTEGRKDKYDVVASISCKTDEQILRREIKKYDAVVCDDISSFERNFILKICFDMDKRVYFTPKISDIIVKSSENLNLFDTPLYLNRNMGMSFGQRFFKRLMDIVLSGVALIILSPVLLITAIAIKKEDGGPVFFRQERCTLNGEKFMILKFRSMIVDAEKDGRPHPAGEEDDRITKVGKIIRATRIDELPQIINILLGDMSIVGPRPERVEHVEKYSEDIPEFVFRTKVKGGLTGYAQVYGKYNTSALDKLKMDMIYIENYSLLLDIQIIFETIRVIFQKDSTEGFSEEQQEEMLRYEEEREHFRNDR